MADEPEGSPPSQPTAPQAPSAPAGGQVAAAPAPPVTPPAVKPAAPAAQPAPADMTRRGFFSWAAVAWVGFTVAIGGCVTAMGRFMFPNVFFEPPTPFKVGT